MLIHTCQIFCVTHLLALVARNQLTYFKQKFEYGAFDEFLLFLITVWESSISSALEISSDIKFDSCSKEIILLGFESIRDGFHPEAIQVFLECAIQDVLANRSYSFQDVIEMNIVKAVLPAIQKMDFDGFTKIVLSFCSSHVNQEVNAFYFKFKDFLTTSYR